MTNEEAAAMIERLRAGDLCDVELAPKAADMIAALVAERDKALDTVKRVQAAARTLDATRQQIADTYARNSAINKEAVETLNSERAANAILTAELAATREANGILEDALQEVGDDYPGSSCQQWCVQQVKLARAALAKGAATDE